MSGGEFTLTVEIDEARATALAQFCKRVGFSDLRATAKDDDEAYVMRDGVDALRRALADAGFAPR